MVNIYDTANQMEQDLKQTQQYQELKAAYEALKSLCLFQRIARSSRSIATKTNARQYHRRRFQRITRSWC